jgi:catechol 2,3-dioxygenase-like lactoylglutathione lyase family enzyme
VARTGEELLFDDDRNGMSGQKRLNLSVSCPLHPFFVVVQKQFPSPSSQLHYAPILATTRDFQTESPTMLSTSPIIAYVPAADIARARKFYEGTLGFRAAETNEAGVMYEAGAGSRFFVYKTAGAGTNKASTAFWNVPNLETEMADLRKRGVVFEEYDSPGFKTVNGVATGGGAKTAWFKDTEGNIMAVSQRI